MNENGYSNHQEDKMSFFKIKYKKPQYDYVYDIELALITENYGFSESELKNHIEEIFCGELVEIELIQKQT